MRYLKCLFEIYIKGSFHVALMALCFYQLSCYYWLIPSTFSERLLIFFLTFMGYNGIRYYPFNRYPKSTPWLYWVLLPSTLCAFIFSLWQFVFLSNTAQILLFVCCVLSIAYVVPFKVTQKNLRSRFGLKILIVALCWTLLTGVYPLLSLEVWTMEYYQFFFEHLLLIFVAILPFEIRDSASDANELGTVPQLFGIKKTPYLGLIILMLLLGLKLVRLSPYSLELGSFLVMAGAYVALLFKVKPGHSENITLFWAEAVPMLGWLVYYLSP